MTKKEIGHIEFKLKSRVIEGHFRAMANPCAIFIEHDDSHLAQQSIQQMANEVWRIEQKYSRYRSDSMVSAINNARGQPTQIDHETYYLLQLADVLWQESQGMFDITSGIFRKIWTFDAHQSFPSQAQVNDLLMHVGWGRVHLDEQHITLPKAMQIDLGGIGKEYAADRCLTMAKESLGEHILVNLGGDVVAKGSRTNNIPWRIGIESKLGGGDIWKELPLSAGAIATSGDVYKSVLHEGKRYGHIINAINGFPILDPPRTVTIAAPNCTEAGMLSTLAILQGGDAETFLKKQGRPYWLQW